MGEGEVAGEVAVLLGGLEEGLGAGEEPGVDDFTGVLSLVGLGVTQIVHKLVPGWSGRRKF